MNAFCLPSTSLYVSTEQPRFQSRCNRNHGIKNNFARPNSHRCNWAGGTPLKEDKCMLAKGRVGTTRPVTPACTWTNEAPAKVAILVSGGGRSLENICEKIDSAVVNGCKVSLVIASKKSAGAIEKAERRGIPTRVLRLRDFERSTELFSDAISNVLDEYDVDLVVLAGWMHFYLIPSRYEGKVINIHPSLIPAFCGKGYFGHHVHEAVLDFGAKVTGCTVHLADNKYDHGPIILQKPVAVHESDTANDLAARVFETEKEALPEAIQLFVDGRLSLDGRLVRVKSQPISSNI